MREWRQRQRLVHLLHVQRTRCVRRTEVPPVQLIRPRHLAPPHGLQVVRTEMCAVVRGRRKHTVQNCRPLTTKLGGAPMVDTSRLTRHDYGTAFACAWEGGGPTPAKASRSVPSGDIAGRTAERRRGEEGGHADGGAAPTRRRRHYAVPCLSEPSIICQVTPKSHGCVDNGVCPPRSRGNGLGFKSRAGQICLPVLDESVIRRLGP